MALFPFSYDARNGSYSFGHLCLGALYVCMHVNTAHMHYAEAVEGSFHNAQGKAFMQAFLCLLLDNKFETRISTPPKGDRQPGALNVTWVLTTSECSPPSTRSQCTPPSTRSQDRVANVIVLHTTKNVFTIVVEVKSEDIDAAEQNTEQMVGLFYPSCMYVCMYVCVTCLRNKRPCARTIYRVTAVGLKSCN